MPARELGYQPRAPQVLRIHASIADTTFRSVTAVVPERSGAYRWAKKICKVRHARGMVLSALRVCWL